jgi:putative ABC transport system permease protein
MNLFILVVSYLRARLANTVMNIVLLALGITVIVFVLVAGRQLDEKAEANSKGIDLVVGAKGSPLQIILCSIYHIDFPTGNISLLEAERISKHRLVKKAIPLALGDSYQGFRIVGTDTSYSNLFNATLADGRWWAEDLEVVAGSHVARELNLKTGDQFSSAHGMTIEGSAHDEHPYRVVGVMAATGTVLDNLLLTNVASVWEVHGSDSTKEITSMLIKFRNPLAAIQLPRLINSTTSMQAASPAFEMARLYTILGVGVDVLTGLAVILIGISALSTFLALYNALKDRRYDLAIMRAMGAGRSKLFLATVMEGTALTVAGTALGIGAAHALLSLLPSSESELTSGITGMVFYREEAYLLAGSLLLGIVCSVLPAVQASRTNIHEVLAGN